MFTNHYVNIAKNFNRVNPIEIVIPLDPNLDWDTVKNFLKHKENHASVIEIKKPAKTNESFTFPEAKTEDINKIIDLLNPKKVTTSDGIPIKVIKTASEILDSCLTCVINQDIELISIFEFSKVASVSPLHKKEKAAK